MPGIRIVAEVAVKCSCGTDMSEHATVEYSPTGKATVIVPTSCKKCCSKIFADGHKTGFDKGCSKDKLSE